MSGYLADSLVHHASWYVLCVCGIYKQHLMNVGSASYLGVFILFHLLDVCPSVSCRVEKESDNTISKS